MILSSWFFGKKVAKEGKTGMTAQDCLSLGKWLRKQYQDAANFQCIPLTFGDLKAGNKFIAFPLPGDNDGHDGLQGSFHLLLKTKTIVHTEEPSNSVGISDGTHHYFKDDLPVVRVQ